MRRRQWLLTAVIAGVLAVLGAAGWVALKPRPTHPLDLPDDAAVANVTADMFASDLGDPIPPFAVPSEYVPRVLAAFRPAEEYTGKYLPPPDVWFGRVTVQATDGRILTLEIPWAWKEPLIFRSGETWYIRGGPFVPDRVFGSRVEDQWYTSENFALAEALREMGKEQPEGRKRPRIVYHLDKIERSAGRRPPLREPLKIPD
jgi:hypothetical protein